MMLRATLLIGFLLLSATPSNVAHAAKVKARQGPNAAKVKSGEKQIKPKSLLTLKRSGFGAVLVKKGKVIGEPHRGAKILQNSGFEQATGTNSNGAYVINRKGKQVGSYYAKLKQLPNRVLVGYPVAAKRGLFGGIKSSNDLFLVNRKTGKTMGPSHLKIWVKAGKVFGVSSATGAVVELDPKNGDYLRVVPNK